MARKKEMTQRLLTEAELEIMNQVWQRGAASVRETLEAMDAKRPLAYTTVATILKILETKGFLNSEKTYGVLRYTPKISRGDYAALSARHLVQKVFQGAPSALVMRLLDEEPWSPAELDALRERLRQAAGGER